MNSIVRFQRRFHLGYKRMFAAYTIKGYVLYKIVNPFFLMMFFCLVASYTYGKEEIANYVIGNALLMCSFSVFFGVGQTFNSERSQGTLETIICSPSHTLKIILPQVLIYVADSLLSVFVGFLTGAIFFEFRISIEHLGWFVVITFIGIFSAMGFGMLIGVFALLTRDVFLLLNIVSMALLAFSGAEFELSLLPYHLGFIGKVLPLTRSIEAMRLLNAGVTSAEFFTVLISEFLIGIAFFALGVIVYKQIERMAVRYGSLNFY